MSCPKNVGVIREGRLITKIPFQTGGLVERGGEGLIEFLQYLLSAIKYCLQKCTQSGFYSTTGLYLLPSHLLPFCTYTGKGYGTRDATRLV